MKNHRLHLFIFSAGILSALLVAISYLFNTVSTSLLFNSDSMYLPMLFDDVFKDGGNFFSWYLTPAPGFFPDMALFFAVRALVSNTYFNFLFFSLTQITLSYILGLIAIRSFSPGSPENHKNYLIFCCFFLLTIVGLVIKGHTPYIFSLLPVYRFGAIFNTLILISSIFFSFNFQNRSSKIGIFIICALGTATDLMFLPMAIFPATLATIIAAVACSKSLPWKRGIGTIALMLAGAISGLLLKELIFPNDTTSRYIGINNTPFWEQARILGSIIGESFSLNPFAGLTIFAFYCLVVWQLIALLKAENRDYKRLYLLSFLLLSPLLTSLAVTTNGVLTEILVDTRYISNLYWNPIFFSWVVACPLLFNPLVNAKFTKIALISLTVFISLNSFPFSRLSQSNLQLSHYPELVKCVDETIDKYQGATGESISRGVALYWEAKLISHFSKNNLKVLQLLSGLSPFLWINNSDWYAQPIYDFAVLPIAQEGLSSPYQTDALFSARDLVLSINGEPKSQEVCSIKSEPLSADEPAERLDFAVMIYGAEMLKTERFALGARGTKILACTLPTQVGVPREEDCEMAASESSSQGYLTFGPYLEVPTGAYRALIEYESEATVDTVVGEWDIALELGGELNVLKNGVLKSSEESSTLEIRFEVPKDLDGGILEIRTKGKDAYPLTIQSIFIERVEP